MNTHPLPFRVQFEPRMREEELVGVLAEYGRVE
jgi:hypothetical protein